MRPHRHRAMQQQCSVNGSEKDSKKILTHISGSVEYAALTETNRKVLKVKRSLTI